MTLEDQDVIFDPSYISDVPATAVRQRSHPMQLRSAKVQISLNEMNIGGLATKQQCDTMGITVKHV